VKDAREDDDAGVDRVLCPEPHCGIEMITRNEVNAHLRWDHNRSKDEAKAMLDAE